MGEGNSDKDRRMEARYRILRYLSGQLDAAASDDDPCCWLARDGNGDKLSPENLEAARSEAKLICEELGVMTAFRIEILL
jgi:hypothetical protein